MDVSVIKELAGPAAPNPLAIRGSAPTDPFEEELERAVQRRSADQQAARTREQERARAHRSEAEAPREPDARTADEARHASETDRQRDADAARDQADREEPPAPPSDSASRPEQDKGSEADGKPSPTDQAAESPDSPPQDAAKDTAKDTAKDAAKDAATSPVLAGGSEKAAAPSGDIVIAAAGGKPAGTLSGSGSGAQSNPVQPTPATAPGAAGAAKNQPLPAGATANRATAGLTGGVTPDGKALPADAAADPFELPGLVPARDRAGHGSQPLDRLPDPTAIWNKAKGADTAMGAAAGTTAEATTGAKSPLTPAGGQGAETAGAKPAAAPPATPAATALALGGDTALPSGMSGDGQTAAGVGAGQGTGTASQASQLSQSMPVRTAAPGQPPTVQVAIHLARAVQDGQNRISIRLDPPELGRVDVKLDVGHDGRVTAVVTADRSDTLDLLQRDARTLARALQDAGLEAGSNSLNFSLRQQDQNADPRFAQGGPQAGPGADVPRLEEDLPPQRGNALRTASSRALDISI